MGYKETQRNLQVQKLLYQHPELFRKDKGGAPFQKYESLIFVLQDGINNLYPAIQSDAVDYFEKNKIAWWGDHTEVPTGHLLSSQIQCLNFLFALRDDEQAVLQLAKLFDDSIEAVYSVPGDTEPTFLAFEFVYENKAFLNEDDDDAQRGAFCTSVDVFLIANRRGQKLLMPIEWKYTESYLDPENKAMEKWKGKTRQTRYNQLITDSKQLKTPEDMVQSIYYREPYYELMRQTLLVEKMIDNKVADDFLHILATPGANADLLQESYACEEQVLDEVWKGQLLRPEKFQRIDSAQIFGLLGQMPDYSALYDYLKLRYY